MRHRSLLFAVLTAVVFAVLAAGGFAQDRRMVIFTYEPKPGDQSDPADCAKAPPWPLDNYGIAARRYNRATFKDGLAADLDTARLLVNVGFDQVNEIFRDPAVVKALTAFFARGGVLFFGYGGQPNPADPAVKAFFDGAGVRLPARVPAARQLVVAAPGADTVPLLTQPNDLPALVKRDTKVRASTDGYFEPPPGGGFRALLVVEGDPGRIGWLIQTNVLGRGAVILASSSRLLSDVNRAPYKEMLENLLTYAFGPLPTGQAAGLETPAAGGPATMAAPAGTEPGWITQLPVDRLNPYYLQGLADAPWWNPEWGFRRPLVVWEALGVNRRHLLVDVAAPFPAGIEPASLRVVTPWGEEIPSQARRLEGEENRIEVLFTADFLAHENRCFFLYFDAHGKAPLAYPAAGLSLAETDEYYVLENDALVAKLLKTVPAVVHLEPRGSETGSQFGTDYGLAPHGFGARFGGIVFNGADTNLVVPRFEVALEDGPIRKTVAYRGVVGGQPLTVSFALDRGGTYLSRVCRSPSNQALTFDTRWLPGRGRDEDQPDAFYYPGTAQVVRLSVGGDEMLASLARPALGEGWYAFEDRETGQACGELYDLGAIGSLSAASYGSRCYRAQWSLALAPDIPAHGALVALPDRSGARGVREAYRRFKQPPHAAFGDDQRREACPARPAVPAVGRRQLRGYLVIASHGDKGATGYAFPEQPANILPHLLRELRAQGANTIWAESHMAFYKTAYASTLMARQDFLGDLVWQGHAQGLAVIGSLINLRGKWFWGDAIPWDGDWVHWREHVRRGVRELARYDLDFCQLMDETVYVVGQSRGSRPRVLEEFQARYGGAPVSNVAPERLAEPAQHNTVLCQMDTYTDIIRDMTRAYKSVNTNTLIFDLVNPSSMTRVQHGAPHDWAAHAGFLDAICMDLYGKPIGAFKYYVKFMRAMMRGRGPVIVVGGCGTPDKDVIANMGHSMMWGADVYLQFPKRGHSDPRFYDETQRAFRYLEYTGVGDRLAAWEPVPRLAVFWDRAGLVHAITNGRWGFSGSDYDVQAQNMTLMRNLQTEIVMSRGATPATLGAFPLVWVIDHPAMPEAAAEALAGYVRQGGTAVIEAEGIRSPILQALCGVKPAGPPAARSVRHAGPAPFSFTGRGLLVASESAQPFLKLDEATTLYVRAAGKGRALYLPIALSEKAGVQDDVTAFIRRLADDLVGPPVLTVEPDEPRAVDSNIFSDGTNLLLAVYNPGFAGAAVQVRFHGARAPEALGDLATGEVAAFGGAAALAIGAGQVKHWYVGARSAIAPPACRQVAAGTSVSYAAAPGQDLRVEAVRAPAAGAAPAAALTRERLQGRARIGILTDRDREDPRSDQRVTGDLGTYDVLRGLEGIEVVWLADLNPETLAACDAVIVPNVGSGARPSVMGAGWEQRLRAYVLGGGAALLNHHAVGYVPCDGPAFPEVGRQAKDAVVELQDVGIAARHPVTDAAARLRRFPEKAANPAYQAQLDVSAFATGQVFRTGFVDYVPLAPGPQGAVLARSVAAGGRGGDAVLVAGPVGRGKVLLSGLSLGETMDRGADGKWRRREGAAPGDAQLLVNAAYWLTEKETP